MITDEGKIYIKRFLAGYVQTLGEAIAVGISDEVQTPSRTHLGFEIERVGVEFAGYDFDSEQVVFKATLPDGISGVIHEVGLYSSAENQMAGEYDSSIITTFDSETEDWQNLSTSEMSDFVSGSNRVGINALTQSPSANGSTTDVLRDLSLDLSGFSSSDRFTFAFNCNNENTSSIRFRFMTDSANYYDLTVEPQGSGYNIVGLLKGAAVATGVPDWGNITELRVTTNSTAGGGAVVGFDGIRIEDLDTPNPNHVLLATQLLPNPFVKADEKIQEIEFTLDVNL